MAQSSVFSQVIKLIPRSHFQSIVHKYNADKGIRQMDCWTWFGALLFGQLTGHDSIRAIERVFAHSDPQMKKLGFGPVRRSTLADANQSRPVELLEDVFKEVLVRAKQVAPKKRFKFNGQVLALDSTIIRLCLKLCPWATYHSGHGAIKLQTAIDVANQLPDFFVLTEGIVHDTKATKYFHFNPGTTVVFDRGYNEWNWMDQLNKNKVFFVTRAKKNLHFKVVQSQAVDRTRGHVCDQIVYVKRGGKHPYQGKLRRISYYDPDTGKKLVFMTNRFDLATQTICDLYKSRWDVELFFKTMKQQLRIKKFLGTSANAVKAQIIVALIAYLLVQILRFTFNSNISNVDAMAVVGTLLLLKEPVSRLLGKLPLVNRHPPSFQLSFIT